ncbi:MAG: class I SAM-dependent methyltransferase [Cyanobacteriota bacterium]|nr:class I SAM-dependent methyltransferase [Cyanobacteriota bacterium]
MVTPAHDRLLEAWIPGYASLARLSVSLLAASPLARAPGAEVLVAGCGSGAELVEARRLRPDWRLTAVDPSAEMLTLARGKLAGAAPDAEASAKAPPIQWLEGTVEELAVDPCFDGALAVLVLQGLPDDGGKLRFLTSLARWLRPGAQVVLVDQMQPERTGMERQLITARRLFQGRAEVSQQDGQEDQPLGPLHPISLTRLAGLLEATAFSDPVPVFRALDYEGFVVKRLE